MKLKHNEISEEQILLQIRAIGYIGRHKYKTRNDNINKKLRRMVKDKKLILLQNTRDFTYYGLPKIETLK